MSRLYRRVPILVQRLRTERIDERLLAAIRRRTDPRLAALHRWRLQRTTFIGITGSAGKTTTKLMLGAVLRSKYQGSFRESSANRAHHIARSILMARSSDQFCVVELSGGGGPGCLAKPLDLLKPSIGVVTCIGLDHRSAFGSQDAIAAEKGRLIRELPENGVAVLNADDPRVIAMRDGCRARVISFGITPGADVRAESVRATWPDRLSFELVYDGARVPVQTRMCGTQWTSSALAAAAAGLAMNVSLADIARSLGSVEPFQARMSPLVLPDGVTFVRDDEKASSTTIPPAFEFLRTARAVRKLAIIGTLSDYAGSSSAHYVKIARYALEVADVVIFVGPRATKAARARPTDEPERLRSYSTAKAATDFLSTFLKAGDLVLLKGSNPADHLYRIALSRISPVSCWRENCHRRMFCDECDLVRSGSGPQTANGAERQRVPGNGASIAGLESGMSVLVGLGNPGTRYANTPHNVGYAVLDSIALETQAVWSEVPGALVAVVDWHGIPLCLLKPQASMNRSGSVLHELFQQCDVEPSQVVLVFDDIDMPLGKVRARMRGSDGGHRGVRSILEAFQTDQFPRVKIGVRRATEAESAPKAVLRQFTETEEPLVSAGIEQARSRLQEVVKSSGRHSETTR
jgi:aminoacyl-tRNA hydrolase